MPLSLNTDLLQAALSGFEHQLVVLDRRITELRVELGAGSIPTHGRPTTGAPPSKRRAMNDAARRRMAVAQRRRWKAWRAARTTA